MPATVLSIVPHPDDADFAAGGLLAKYARDGARVVVAIATDGARGTLGAGGPALAARREAEARAAAAALGAAQPVFLGWPDFGLDEVPQAQVRERLVRLVRETRPQVLVIQDPLEFDPHPDHRALALAASDAANFSMLSALYPEQGLEPWFVPEKLFYSDGSPRSDFFVDIGDVLALKIGAVLAHESQVEFLVEDVMRQAEAAGLPRLEVAGAMEAMMDESGVRSPSAIVAWAVRQSAAAVGARAGCAFAEAYRRVRFHPYVEALIPQLGPEDQERK
jgi:LmbE family N-acetylglucosaminyl deacetylase